MSSRGLPSSALLALLFLAGGAGCAGTPPPPAKTGQSAPPAAAPAPKPVAAAAPAVAVVGPPLPIIPAAAARPLLLASITIPSIDRSLAGGTALLTLAVPLPLDGPAVKEMLLSQAGLPPEVAKSLDTASPAGAVVVALGEGGGTGGVGLVMAVSARNAPDAERVIGALGQVISKRGEVLELDNRSGGRGWVWRSGSVIVLSDSVLALQRGAMLALDARQVGAGEDISAILYPDRIARANGTDIPNALGALLAQVRAVRAAQVAADGAAPADAAFSDPSLDALEEMAAYGTDADTVEVGLVADVKRGLSIDLHVHARAGTPLEKVARETHPFEIDPSLAAGAPALAGGADLGFVLGSSYGPFSRAVMARQRARLQARLEAHGGAKGAKGAKVDKGAPAALQLVDAWTETIAGPWSAVGRVKPSLSFQAIYPLKDAAAAARLGDALAHADTAALVALWKAEVSPAQARIVDWRGKTESIGKLKALHVTLLPNTKAMTTSQRDGWKAILGDKSLDVYVAVAGTRAVVTTGKDARPQLVALAAGKKRIEGKAQPGDAGEEGGRAALATALEAARGRDTFGYLDFQPIVGLAASMAADPRAKVMAGGARAAIPVYGTFSGDGDKRLLTFETTLPPSAFSGVGAIVQAMGASGAGPAAPEPP